MATITANGRLYLNSNGSRSESGWPTGNEPIGCYYGDTRSPVFRISITSDSGEKVSSFNLTTTVASGSTQLSTAGVS